MFKAIKILIVVFLLLGCAEESTDNSGEDDNSSSDSLEALGSKSINLSSNLSELKYSIDSYSPQVSTNFSTLSVNSGDSGFIYGLSTNDQVLPIINNLDSGSFSQIHKNGRQNLFIGDVLIDNVRCLVIFESGDASKCIVQKSQEVSSANAVFNGENVFVYLALNGSDEKQLYKFQSDDSYLKFERFNNDKTSVALEGDVIAGYATNDYLTFLTEKNGVKRVITYDYINTFPPYFDVKIKEINGELIIIDGVAYYNDELNFHGGRNNATAAYNGHDGYISSLLGSEVLTTYKDAAFTFFTSPNYKAIASSGHSEDFVSNPNIFYLRKILNPGQSQPLYYPTPISLNDTFSDINPIDWTVARGYKEFVLAYGVSGDRNIQTFEENKTTVNKAIILIDGKNKVEDSNSIRLGSDGLDLYDSENPSSDADNLINVLSYDAVTSITNYVNGFKLEGTVHGQPKESFFNPVTKAIETPSTSDQQTFVIKERL